MSKPGVSAVYWDNLGEGWRMDCAAEDCQFTTAPGHHLTEVAWDMEDHWEDDHQ